MVLNDKLCKFICYLANNGIGNVLWHYLWNYLNWTCFKCVCATPPTPHNGFCSYPHTVTNMTWRWW